MRKIDKKCNLSTVYSLWESNLTTPHPTYNSSKGKYYKDIVTQLLYCQNGLCAFTERRLSDERDYDTSHWQEGRYSPDKPHFEGELDHFDSTRKTNEAWAWDNFLVASTHINQKIKGSKPVDDILKPDHPNYNEYRVLSYDPTINEFIPNDQNLTAKEQARVQIMIDTLGLNFGSIVRVRREYLERTFKLIELTEDVNDVTITQFPTAYEMTNILKATDSEGSILDSL